MTAHPTDKRSGEGRFLALDYGTDGAAIQSAIAAANTAGGGTVVIGPGTWALGGTGLTIPGNNIEVRGAGKGATILTYTGSGAAFTNSAVASTRTFCGLHDLTIDITGGSTGATCLTIDNFYRGFFSNLDLKGGTTTFDCLKLDATGGHSTYYNTFLNVDASTSGICVHFTGSGAINRNNFYNGLWSGAGKALVVDTTASTCDTTLFCNQTVTCTATPTVVQLGGSGGAVRYFTFLNWLMETGTSAAIVCATASGTAANCTWIGGIFGSVTITTQDNLANFILVPGQGGLDFSQLSGQGSDADAAWFVRDNGGMTFGSGKDVNLYRGGSNLLKTDDKLVAASIGVGNSAAATTPGSVSKKIEVFDASGTSIGFLAVYTSIT